MRTAITTAVALIAFAGNSVLCRMALGELTIDAATFSTIRLISGALTLWLILTWSKTETSRDDASWISGLFLFLYAVPFSFAYLDLTAGTGALILFGAVQVTMMLAALSAGERPNLLQWIGLPLAAAGLVYLVLPGLKAPPLVGSALMAFAGFSWGVYSLRGRGAKNPLAQTSGNFARAVPFAVLVSLVAIPQFHVELPGALLAIASGAVASGLGYVVWYSALRGLTATRAAVVQLLVPILAAVGGVLFLSEEITLRLALSAALVLGGIGLSLAGRELRSARKNAPPTEPR